MRKTAENNAIYHLISPRPQDPPKHRLATTPNPEEKLLTIHQSLKSESLKVTGVIKRWQDGDLKTAVKGDAFFRLLLLSYSYSYAYSQSYSYSYFFLTVILQVRW